MRGRKQIGKLLIGVKSFFIKKESPNEGTETIFYKTYFDILRLSLIKKESPNEGTETIDEFFDFRFQARNGIKKESPNEGTETNIC